jgi:integrase
VAGKLSTLKLRSLVRPGLHNDGNGLYLQIKGTGKSWLFRYKLHNRTRDMGLGAIAGVPLAEARELATAARRLVRQGKDPIDTRRADRATVAAQGLHTFREVAAAYVAAHAPGWRNAKHAAQWTSTLESYAYPVMGNLPVAVIGLAEVTRMLQPIWTTKPETASRVRGRVEHVLAYAAVNGWREPANPALWKGNLDKVLPARAKLARVQHHPAVPWQQIGVCTAALSRSEGVAAAALRFIVLTAARSGEARGATWAEVDLQAGTWVVPGTRMKAGNDHKVPLSTPALAILAEMSPHKQSDDSLIFPGGREGKPLSDVALAKALSVAGFADYTTHGMRSTFRDWAAERTNFPREIAEAALAHTLRDKTEAAYRRSDLFEKRRALMKAWAEHCTRAATTGEVSPLRQARG